MIYGTRVEWHKYLVSYEQKSTIYVAVLEFYAKPGLFLSETDATIPQWHILWINPEGKSPTEQIHVWKFHSDLTYLNVVHWLI